VPRDLETICLKCLEKEPTRRYPSAAALAADLRRYLAGESILARPVGVVGRIIKRARRHPAITVLLVTIVITVLAGVAGGFGYWHERQQRRTRVAGEVQTALEETVALYGRAEGADTDMRKWAEALSAAKHTSALAASPDAPADLRTRADALVVDIDRQEKKRRLLSALVEIHSSMGDDLNANGGQDFVKANARYTQVFADFGIDLLAYSPEQAAGRLRALGVDGVGVAKILDMWAYLSMSVGIQQTQHLLNVARVLDPDPVRDRIRLAIIAHDVPGLQRLATEMDPATQSSHTVNLVAVCLSSFPHTSNYAFEIPFLLNARPYHSDDFQINHNLAFFLNRAKRWDEAIIYATAATAVRSSSAAAWQVVAESCRMLHRDDEALAAHRRVAELAPRAVGHLYWAGVLLEGQDRSGEAEAAFREAGKRAAQYRARLDDGELLRAWERYGLLGDVAAELRRIIALDPNRVDNYLAFIRFLKKQEKWAELLTMYDELVRLEPKNLTYLTDRAFVHAELADLGQGSWQEVTADLKRVTDLGSTNIMVWYCHALLVLNQGNREAFCAECQEIFDRFGNTKDAQTANDVAAICSQTSGVLNESQKRQAVQLATLAVRGRPDNHTYQNTLGMALYRAGELEAARAQFEKSLQAKTRDEDLYDWLDLAMVHHDLGHTERAKEYYAQAGRWLELNRSLFSAPSETYSWADKLELEILRREVAATLKK
jgi:tetratricopeptide (TPR) repeat protein